MITEAQSALAALVHIGGRLKLAGDKIIVNWAGPRDEPIAVRLRAVKEQLRPMLTPLTAEGFVEAAGRLFNATVIEDPEEPQHHDDEWPLPRRLATIDALLDSRDARGRINYTQSEIESSRIGLRSFAGQPGADAMLARLHDAKKSALTAAVLARRMSDQ